MSDSRKACLVRRECGRELLRRVRGRLLARPGEEGKVVLAEVEVGGGVDGVGGEGGDGVGEGAVRWSI